MGTQRHRPDRGRRACGASSPGVAARSTSPTGPSPGRVHTDWVLIDARGALTRVPPIFGEKFGGEQLRDAVGRLALPPTPVDAPRHAFAVRLHELDPMAHVNNAVYLDWLDESIAAEPAGTVAIAAVPRRYRCEFARRRRGGHAARGGRLARR